MRNLIPRSNSGGDKNRVQCCCRINRCLPSFKGRTHSRRVISAITIALTSPNYSSNAEVKLADPVKHHLLSPVLPLSLSLQHMAKHNGGTAAATTGALGSCSQNTSQSDYMLQQLSLPKIQ